MFKKSLIVLSSALVVAMTLVSAADAQTQRRDGVRPFTEVERQWFLVPEAPERMN